MSETENTPEGTPPAESGNAEAAKWRTKLREAEGERDTLAGRVEQMQWDEVLRLAGDHVAKPDALRAAGVELKDVLGDDGNVDPDKVKTATLDAAERLGLTRPDRGGRVPSEGGNSRPVVKKTFEDAFKL